MVYHNEYQLDMVLNIKSVQVSDFGVYTCKVYNSYGQGIAVQMIQGKKPETRSNHNTTRGYQKVRRLMRWNQYFDFLGNIIKQMFYQLWKFELYTLIINHFITKNNLYGMVTRRSLRWVSWRSTTSLFFIVTLYTLRHFWLSTQKSMIYMYRHISRAVHEHLSSKFIPLM